MTTGAPITEVIAFIGKVISFPELEQLYRNKASQWHQVKAYSKQHKMITRLKQQFRHMGTAKPINAIGPAKAVMLPAKILVAIIIKNVFYN